MERGLWKPNVEISPNCPRCGSTNTKFCYYNNYSLTQPRYFCKGCRRYWTRGGSLRNVPVGGGNRRRQRRGRSLRLATNGISSKKSIYVSTSNQAIENSYGPSNGSSAVNSRSALVGHDDSHIDLALVYANFLSKKPESNANGHEIQELSSNNCDHTTQELTNLSSKTIQDPSGIPLLEQNGQAAGFLGLSDRYAETYLSESSDHLYFNGFEALYNGQERIQYPTTQEAGMEYALPPLPGEDMVSQETNWSSKILVCHDPMQSTNFPLLVPNAQDAKLLLSNWNPFDL